MSTALPTLGAWRSQHSCDLYVNLTDGEYVDFRLTYEGDLLAHRDDKRLAERCLHVHKIRKVFHRQLKRLCEVHPTLSHRMRDAAAKGIDPFPTMDHDGFQWMTLVPRDWGLVCGVEILMLREGLPGRVLFDVDNRLKTVFDALRKAHNPSELGLGTSTGLQVPDANEKPFFVLLEDDSLITHVAVTTDSLLEPVPGAAPDLAVRLVLNVSIRPYKATQRNLNFVS